MRTECFVIWTASIDTGCGLFIFVIELQTGVLVILLMLRCLCGVNGTGPEQNVLLVSTMIYVGLVNLDV